MGPPIPATVAAIVSALIVVAITREVGDDWRAQTLCARAYPFAATPLLFGHLLLTSAVDLVVWPLACLFALRALRRDEPRWWLWFGVTIGLDTYNKLLIALLVIALVIGVLLAGPRRFQHYD